MEQLSIQFPKHYHLLLRGALAQEKRCEGDPADERWAQNSLSACTSQWVGFLVPLNRECFERRNLIVEQLE